MKKPLCLHFHIFKNAGTTVDLALERQFGKAFGATDGPEPGSRLGPEAILSYLESHPETKVLSSHQFRFPLPESDEFAFLPLVFLRHPLDRALSVHAFERRQGGCTPGSRMAGRLDLPAYVRWRLGQGAVTVVSDFQTSVLSFRAADPPGRTLTPADRERALRNLKRCVAPGVVERLDESLLCVEEALSPFFGPMDLSYLPANVTTGRRPDLAGRLEEGRSRLGEALMAELAARNAGDMALYLEANKELDRRTAALPGFAARLADFRERCARLRRGAGSRGASPEQGRGLRGNKNAAGGEKKRAGPGRLGRFW